MHVAVNWGGVYEPCVEFVRKNGMVMLATDLSKDYSDMDVKVYADSGRNGLKYVVTLEGKKLYYPRTMEEKRIKHAYINLLKEQDHNSPHRYFDKLNYPEKEDILVDVGAAEGLISLLFADKVKKVYAIESEEEWVECLNATFEGYDNVEIISAFIGQKEGSKELKDVINEKDHLIIKMDIEGNEIDALSGMKDILKSSKNKYAICVYHKYDDYKNIADIMDKNQITWHYSDGYMLLWWMEDYKYPYFRRGVIRGKKE